MKDQLICHGGALKALGDGRLRGPLVRFTDAADKDLDGEYFTAETDLGGATAVGVYYNHGQDTHIKNRRLAVGTLEVDDVGAWIEFQLSMRDEYEKAIYAMAEAGKVGLSSGAVAHLVEVEGGGFIKAWPIGEASITPTPAEPRNSLEPLKGWTPPDLDLTPQQPIIVNITMDGAALSDAAQKATSTQEGEPMADEPQNTNTDGDAAATQAPAYTQEQMDAAVKAASEAAAEAAASKTRKAFEAAEATTALEADKNSGPAIITASYSKYDNTDTFSLAYATEFLAKSARTIQTATPPSPQMVNALAYRLATDAKHVRESRDLSEAKGVLAQSLRGKSIQDAIKANEIHQSTLANASDEWVGVAYSGDLWDEVRSESFVLDSFNPRDWMWPGSESVVIPINEGDVTVYKVAQASAQATNPDSNPTNTVTSSKHNSGQVTATLAKLGARSFYTGELAEDAVLPFASFLRDNHRIAMTETLESALIDGDTTTTASTNINDIAGTPGSTDYFLVWDGLRHIGLDENTANSRSGSTLADDDFIETLRLMGTAGKDARNRTRVRFLSDPSTWFKALQLDVVKTRDVFSQPTIEGGELAMVYGVQYRPSYFFHWKDSDLLANTSGKVDQDTPGNNTTGSLLAYRPDRFLFFYRRRMTMETMRWPGADTTEIVTQMRASFTNRDTEAAAITYNITV